MDPAEPGEVIGSSVPATYAASVPYTILPHTADTGIAATAANLPELIGDLATGMFASMAKLPPAGPGRRVRIDVTSDSVEDLVVDVLAELLTRAEIDDIVFTTFDVEFSGPNRAVVTAHGVDVEEVEAVGPPIKAVTYHDLTVRSHDDGSWEAVVYFDV
jgi:SHS2 domain-containing protein